MTSPGRHVVVLGLMGAGKSSIGRRVATRLGWPLIDSDDVLEQQTGRTAAELADSEGVDALHAKEAAIAVACLRESQPAVITPAASVAEVAAVRDALAGHVVVWLTAPPDVLASRAVGKTHRPLLDRADPVELLRRQAAEREPLVRPLAAVVIDTSTTSKDDAADQIAELVLSRSAAGPSSPSPPSSPPASSPVPSSRPPSPLPPSSPRPSSPRPSSSPPS